MRSQSRVRARRLRACLRSGRAGRRSDHHRQVGPADDRRASTDAPLYQWPVSTGKAGFDTPSGKFKAFRMERDHYSREWDDAPMPFSIFFTQKGHAIHGSLDTKNIGRPASHGCVRLTPANAEKLFALVQEDGVLNTTVILTGTRPRARRPWRSSARRMRAMCSSTAAAAIRPALRLEPAGLRQSVYAQRPITRSRNMLSRSTRNHSTRSPNTRSRSMASPPTPSRNTCSRSARSMSIHTAGRTSARARPFLTSARAREPVDAAFALIGLR